MIASAGFVAGIINTLAGGGSLLTVPLLVLIGLPGTVANATNRVGVLVQSVVGAWRFRAEGVSGFRASRAVLLPLVAGSAVGAAAVARLDDRTFEQAFGVVMLLLLLPALFPPRLSAFGRQAPLGRGARAATFFAIGLYGGAFQAGVGLFLVLALARLGHDLVRANSIKVVTIAAFTGVAVVIFVLEGQVAWIPALLLSAGTSIGAACGARLAVRGGDRVIRPVLVVCVVALAGKMLGFY